MKDLKRLLRQSSWYLVGHALVTIVGFASFPIWTRILSVEEYGILSLVNATIFFALAISKFGLQKSAIRFFSEFCSGKRNLPISSFYSTLTIGSLVLSTLVGIIFWVLLNIMGERNSGGLEVYNLLHLTIVLVVTGSVSAVLFSFLRVEQEAKLYAGFSIFQRYAEFALSVMLVMVFFWGVKGLFVAKISVEALIIIVLGALLWRQKKLILTTLSPGFLGESLRFGVPLISAELANVISNLGDRYVLQFFMGAQAVGLYSAGYNLTTALQSLLSVPIMLAVTPMYLSIWEEKGPAQTREFVDSALDYYLMVAIPSIILFSFLGGEILELMASPKYLEGRFILPYLAAPLIIDGANCIYAAGLFIHKKTLVIMYFTLGAGLLNLILNLFLVPHLGLIGAAISTFVSYSLLIVSTFVFSSKFLPVQINYRSVANYIIASLATVFLIRFLSFETFIGFIIKMVFGLLIYSGSLMVMDTRMREKVYSILR